MCSSLENIEYDIREAKLLKEEYQCLYFSLSERNKDTDIRNPYGNFFFSEDTCIARLSSKETTLADRRFYERYYNWIEKGKLVYVEFQSTLIWYIDSGKNG
ncbi:hypothetical protein TNCV_3753981 [Trichonephila clavipes]|nr:hypothetical protein TNCV_3753981 [Trichonephila clavipes]